MSIRRILDWVFDEDKDHIYGTIASPFYELYDNAGHWVWAADVDIGKKGPLKNKKDSDGILKGVPVAANNREIIYAEQGKGVMLAKISPGKWVIAGLAKSVKSTIHFIYMIFEDDIFSIAREEFYGDYIRPLTYGELGSIQEPLGYGTLPYGAQGKFDAEGNFIEIVEW
jgi:hypothetical protein